MNYDKLAECPEFTVVNEYVPEVEARGRRGDRVVRGEDRRGRRRRGGAVRDVQGSACGTALTPPGRIDAARRSGARPAPGNFCFCDSGADFGILKPSTRFRRATEQ